MQSFQHKYDQVDKNVWIDNCDVGIADIAASVFTGYKFCEAHEAVGLNDSSALVHQLYAQRKSWFERFAW